MTKKMRELYYRLMDNELVMCNDREFEANNEEILAAKDWDRKYIFSPHSPGFCPKIVGWFTLCRDLVFLVLEVYLLLVFSCVFVVLLHLVYAIR